MKSWKLKILILVLLSALAPTIALAVDFCPVGKYVQIPCITDAGAGPAASQHFGPAAMLVIQMALLVVGALAVIFLIWGGFRYITASGSEEQTEAAKNTIRHAILGLIIVILSFAIITIITRVLITGNPG